jgi:ATP-dependent Lhr-like helicase
MDPADPLDLFLPPVRQWFRDNLGEPTPPQRLGWPAIAGGRHTLILAPTGSGKTLAAFLACLDRLWRERLAGEHPAGVRVLYISPLKALNNDIRRNLESPLEGVAETARRMGQELPVLDAMVRTGDTPTAERQRLVRRPPQVLITTPESLHLLLTSRARDTLRNVSHVIVDEIHALCPNKRGVFLALLLERLEAIQRNDPSFVRIGLSATQRPLDEVARYLGGATLAADGSLTPRPVTVIDTGIRKQLDLQVISPVEQFGPLPEKSVWPSIYRMLADEIRAHRSTLIFTNDRRSAERITSFLNEEEPGLARAHHGSVSLEVRRDIETSLKDGKLPAVVATASLELGIDMGAVDLVCQVASPGNVARALQRVGRAGHLVGQKSKGRLIPRMHSDLLEQAVLAREMAAGRVEAIQVPINCLDVLAQQLVALAAMDEWSVPDLYALARRAYPYRDLSPEAFEATLEMISGRYVLAAPLAGRDEEDESDLDRKPNSSQLLADSCQLEADSSNSKPPSNHNKTSPPRRGTGGRPPTRPNMEALQPRVSWDRVRNRLVALPGSQSLALTNGGTIPDTGQYAAYAGSGVRIGELDEEFIFERRVGDTFLLGTNTWRLDSIEADRVMVSPAEGAPALVPFWKGESVGRSYDLGCAIGAFNRELTARLNDPGRLDWLRDEYHVDAAAARDLCYHAVRQIAATGFLPSDQKLLVEASRDQIGDWQVLLLSPLGSRLHLTLRFVIESRLRQRLGYRPQCMHHDDGIMIRLTDADEPVLDVLEGITPENVESLVLDELADSALFALRFRQNAARALLMPRGKPGRRAPLWLQRMRGRDLLQVARRHADFPVVAETFRECLHGHLDVPRLQTLLEDIRAGRVEVKTRRTEVPSPFASSLTFAFTWAKMYQYDNVEPEGSGARTLDRQLLEQLVAPERQGHLLDPRAINRVERRLRGVGRPPRSTAEMAEWLRQLGDLSASELEGPMAAFLAELEADGRAVRIELPRCREPERYVSAEEAEVYRTAFGLVKAEPDEAQDAGRTILARFLATHALVGLADVLGRYPFDETWARRQLEEWARSGRIVAVDRGGIDEPPQWSAPENLEQVQRGSLAVLRREVVTCPAPQFVDFLLRWQGAHPSERAGSAEALAETLECLQGLPLAAPIWEQTVLPARVAGYQPRWLDEWVAGGAGVWACRGDGDGPPQVAFVGRELLRQLPAPAGSEAAPGEEAGRVLECLRTRGASFLTDLATETGLAPGSCRSALWSLARRGLVTNDRFDAVRHGEPEPPVLAPDLGGRQRAAVVRGPSLRGLRRGAAARAPEGRWSLLSWGHPGPEDLAVTQANLLLRRYGVVARELALLDPWMVPWRVLYEVLSRMELAGDVRRGYFAEGLSGAQFALPEAARALQDLQLPSTAAAPVLLLHSMDPANLYGSGAPFDIALLDGGTRALQRRPGNWLALRAGLPVLLAEQQGRKLTALASASRDDVTAAVACLPAILDANKSGASRHKLSVEEWNGQPVTSTEGRELLESAGFVRDYQGMTLYAAWR